MSDPTLPVVCDDDERRRSVAEPGSTHNGIDWLEVDPADQRILHVGFLHPLPGEPGGVPAAPALDPANVVIEGGERVRGLKVLAVAAADTELTVTVNATGDFSPYTLRLVGSAVDAAPPAGFDPVLSAVEFSFKANCPSDLDCQRPSAVAARPRGPGASDYLARDDEAFRRLLLDRLATLVPGGIDPNPADPLVTVVEALAYVADRLSYRQDAAATEAYLDTARSRVSVRRHARLLDYAVHDGCSARAWVQVQVAATSDVESFGIDPGTVVLAGARAPTVSTEAGETLLADARAVDVVAFETLTRLLPRHACNEVHLYTWGGHYCALPTGATRATLAAPVALGLAVGDPLLLEETRSPLTGRAADADPAHRQVVTLTQVEAAVDPVTGAGIVEVGWAPADALRFPLALSVRLDDLAEAIVCAVARGNLVLAHHAHARTGTLVAGDERWRPVLSTEPLAAGTPPPPTGAPAATALTVDPRAALPLVVLAEEGGEEWTPRRDLLGGDRFDRGFVIEVERDGRAAARFGDDTFSRRPAPGTPFTARWWTGGGTRGNVGRDVLTTVMTDVSGVTGATNPLPAVGGTDPESLEAVRQYAPSAFLTQERAVTVEDWVEVAERLPEVQRAAARFRWTGSWWTVFLTLDLFGGARLADDPRLAARLRDRLDGYRIAGYDLELRDPVDVPVELRLHVCVAPGRFRADVLRRVEEVLSNRVGGDGVLGLFHPDRFTFGQPVYASTIVAAVSAVPGVTDVRIVELHPVGVLPQGEVEAGLLPIGDLEAARLDDDPSAPERGMLHVDLEGGL